MEQQTASYRVLVVDDSEINREITLDVLEPYGFTLAQAESGRQAIEQVEGTAFDLILMDYLMPGLDGMETTKRIRLTCGENGRRPVIIALTADESAETRKQFEESGCQDLLCKPVEPDALHQALVRWLPGLNDAPQPAPLQAQDGNDLHGLEMEGVDLEQTNHKTREQYLHLLSLYALDARKNGSLYRRKVTQDTCDAYRIWVHALKSASANIGAMELSALAREQEEAAKSQDLSLIQQSAPNLFAHYDALLREIERVLQAYGEKEAAEQTVRASISPVELKKELGQALDYLEDFEAKESAKVVEHLLQCDLSQTTRSTLTEVREKLQLYEDDEAEALLRVAIARAS